MEKIIGRYRIHFKDRHFIFSLLVSLILFAASLYINFYAGTYAMEKVSNPVSDIILSNTRVYNLDELFIYGTVFLVISIVLLCLERPQGIPFIVKTIALFVIIRSIFITLTHIGIFPTHITIDPSSFLRDFTFGGDLFFSGHTGLPYLMALIFWRNKYIRYFFIAFSVFLGAVVLLSHLHYSIDVISAYFITYGIFNIAYRLFKRDYKFFNSEV